jgi:hypothetical protein
MSWHPLTVVQCTFTHTQYTEYRGRNIHNNKKLNIHSNKKLTHIGSAGLAASLRVIPWHLPYNRKKHGKTSVRVAARTPQADTEQWTVRYTEEKQLTQSSTVLQNNKQHRIHNREKSPYQVSKSFHSGRNKTCGNQGILSTARCTTFLFHFAIKIYKDQARKN